ncbi:MAG: hypothetical protein K1X55_09255 [Chitinophagales bacterium]|nr:hypothetical protein [Chitinophagales bacterium]
MDKHNKPYRKNLRLQGYDYSQDGLYFITMCVKDRWYLLGEIVEGKMIHSDAGKMIEKWYDKLEDKFHEIRCHEMIVMPDHIHFIIEIKIASNKNTVDPVAADPSVCKNQKTTAEENVCKNEIEIEITDEIYQSIDCLAYIETNESDQKQNPSHKTSLFSVIQWFKTMTTNEYIRGVKNLQWKRFNGKLWQPNYYEHIIRNEEAYRNITLYIRNNPRKWNK